MDFDQLFALRTYFEEEYDDETYIIKAIKTNMIDNGMTNTDANKLIKEFYDSFGIPLNADDLEEVKSIEEIQNEFLTELFENSNTELNNNIQSNNILNTLIRNIINPATMNYVENRNLEDNGIPCNYINNQENENINNQQDENINNQQNENINIQLDELNIQNIPFINNIPNMQFINNFSNGYTSLGNHINRRNIPPNSSIIYNTLMTNLAEQLFSSELINIHDQENVVCTLDEEEKNKLTKVILENNLDKCCSVCMDELVKENEVIILPCNHTFHTNCIEEWLSKYNYICPVCKKEVGKPKYNI